MKQVLLLLCMSFVLLSCKTTKVTKQATEVQNATITSKDTLQSFVSCKSDTLSHKTKQTSTSGFSHVTSEDTSSLLYVVLGQDSITGALRPITGAFIQKRNNKSNDSIYCGITEDDNIDYNAHAYIANIIANQSHNAQQTQSNNKMQSEVEKNRFALSSYVSNALSLLLLLFLLVLAVKYIRNNYI